MPSENELKKMKLLELEKRMASLSLDISDSLFKENPIKRIKAVREEIKEKNRIVDDLIAQLNSYREGADEIKKNLKKSNQDQSSFNKAKNEMDKKYALMAELSDEMDRQHQELNKLGDIFEIITGNEAYKEYRQLYLDKHALNRDLNQADDSITQDLLSFNRIKNNGQASLAEIYANLIQNEKKVIDYFCKIHNFKLDSKHVDGLSKIEFTSTNPNENFSLEIADDYIGASEPLTQDNMRRIIPAMIALFLKGIEYDDSKGCEFTPAAPGVQQYFEEIFSKEIMKRGERFENFRINGRLAGEVAKEANAAILPKENIVPVLPQGMRARG